MVNARPNFIIIGLGNPGERYSRNVHNLGKEALFNLHDFLEKGGVQFSSWQEDRKNRAETCFSANNSLLLAYPTIFMNESGVSAKALLKEKNIIPEKLLVLHDDTDLFLGNAQLCFAKGAAGHHGVESIIQLLGTNEFWRVRIGARHRNITDKAMNLVLKNMTATQKEIMQQLYQKINFGIQEWLSGNYEKATTIINS